VNGQNPCPPRFRSPLPPLKRAGKQLPFASLLLLALSQNEARAGRGLVDLGYGWGTLQSGAEVVGTTASLGLANSAFASFGVEFGTPKNSVRPQLSLQYRVFGASNSAGTTYLLQSVTPLMGLSIAKYWIQLGVTPLLWNQASAGGLAFVTGYTPLQEYLGARVEFGYHYDISPEFSVTACAGTQMFLLATDQSVAGQAIDATIGFRFWIGGVSQLRKERGYFGEEDDKYPGWRYPFGQGM
jgi:hypothetical protein